MQGRLAAYKYPVLTLPNEITSEIFVHFLPLYPNPPPMICPRSPILLGQICKKSREIAFATPKLWRAVRLSGRSEISLLELFLTRSGSCPLSIKLECGLEGDIGQTIMSCSGRWEYMDMYTSQDSLHSVTGSLPLLRSLILSSDINGPRDDSVPTPAFHAAPLLRTVFVPVYRISYHPLLPWSQLTALDIGFIGPQQCMSVLNLAVNLVHCKIYLDHGETEWQPR